MKNLITLVVCTFIFQISYGQTKMVKPFSGITISGSIEAELIQSSEEKVEYVIIKGDEENLIIKNVKNELIIKTQGKWYKGTQTKAKVTVYYKEIDDLEVSSGSSVVVKGAIETSSFDLEVSSGASCTVEIETKHLDLELSSGSSIKLDGSCDDMDGEVSSGSSLRAKGFTAEKVEMELSSGSSASIVVTKSLEGEVSSGSSLRYGGDPSVDVEKDISSSVSRKSY